MNHYKINPTPWNENLNVKSGMVVSFQNGLFLNIDGKSNGVQTPNLDSSYVYIGEVTKDGSFILKDGSNLNEFDIEGLRSKLRFLSKDEYTNEEGLILSEKILLPSYVDDVIEGYYNEGDFYSDANFQNPIIGESGKIYLDLLTQETFRWTGSLFSLVGVRRMKLSLSDDSTGTNGYEIVNSGI